MKFWPGTKRHYDEGEFDVLIIDSAPLVLLCDCCLPEVSGWYMRSFYKPLQAYQSPSDLLNIFRPIAGFSYQIKR